MKPLTVTTSEAHLLAVARHYNTIVFLENDKYMVTKRMLDGLNEEIEYRAPLTMELTA